MEKVDNPISAVEGVELRWLEGDELQVLEPILEKRGWSSLNGVTARALCAFIDNELVGFHIIQLYPHAEPLFVVPECYGTGLAEMLSDNMLEFLKDVRARGFIVIADSPHAEKICIDRGMMKVESPVYMMAPVKGVH